MSLQEMLDKSIWGRNLSPAEMQRVQAECRERRVAAGQSIVRMGETAEHWVGLISGFGKMSVGSPDGRETTLIGTAPGGWFGEGTLIKRGSWQYEGVALRDSHLALLPRETFEWLRATSLPFNHYLQHLMNARMGSFIAQLCNQRLLDCTARVARSLAALYNPELYPEPGLFLDLRQVEVAQLAGISRQRANAALQRLEAAGLLNISRRGIEVLSLAGLRDYSSPPAD
ncbi:Crp/Fnr family transcriptional regulator [Paucibacter sp. PLA-PC-4]|uniref:Crp/Fnr family transcriptional regulator n=1 Tax=Paucibacter sp. PLA-PC-4 TaxID=2993655 RepID=UPI0022490B02|nr:Crp/Fnr family transcriptional regulator [Paucibacter sp. PLA-PC-4]MCX2862735.1 Crp/Fnr family transcriptional regulator [Paucibacter sp. PLA-PC-4]